ncbi:metal-sulfur cluster assembly factor [[Eubacterium] cellulosolvens]
MEEIVKALKECYDPEIPVNVWDLGLIYDVSVDGEKVHVKMTLTAPGCPMHTFISQEVKEKLQSISGVNEATVEVVWDPPWTPDKMSPQAKAQLGIS